MRVFLKKLMFSMLAVAIMSLLTSVAQAQFPGQPSMIAENGIGGRGGGDNLSSGYAWFPNKQNITYCVEKSASFPYTQKQLTQKIDAAFAKWTKYIQLKTIKANGVSIGPKVLPDPKNIAAVNHRTCSFKNVDLIFYFGKETQLTKKFKPLYFDPAAFSHSGYFDEKSTDKKGLVWFAEPKGYTIQNLANLINSGDHPIMNSKKCRSVDIDWKEPMALEIMLGHELSHIVGNPYVEGTIADEFIFRNLLLEKWKARKSCLCVSGVETEQEREKLVNSRGGRKFHTCHIYQKNKTDNGAFARRLKTLLTIDQKRELYFHKDWLSHSSQFNGRPTHVLSQVTRDGKFSQVRSVKFYLRKYNQAIDTAAIKNQIFRWTFSWMEFFSTDGKSIGKIAMRFPNNFGEKSPIHTGKIVFRGGLHNEKLRHASFNRHTIASIYNKRTKSYEHKTLIITRSKGFESSLGIFYLDPDRKVRALFRGQP